jgi:hypothetical protein
MMRNYKLLFFIAITCLSFSAEGQVWDHTIGLSSSSNVNLHTSDQITFNASFNIHGADSIVMQNGNYSTLFTISNRTGIWDDINATGSMDFEILFRGTAGTVKIERDATGLFLIVDLSSNSSTGIKQKFIIDSFTVTE